MIPDLESIRCFVAAARNRSFRRAARVVALSPAAFSERIQRLEALAGTKLFERSATSTSLSAEGRRFLPGAERLLAAAETLFVETPRSVPFELTIGTRFELGMSWLLPSLKGLSKARPDRRLHLFFGDRELLPAVHAGEIDAAITSVRITDARVTYAVLHEEAYAFVGSPRSLRRTPLKAPADAARHALLDVHPDLPLFRYFLDAVPRAQTWAFGGTEYLGTIAAIRARAVEGAGVAVLPRYFVADDLRRRRLTEIRPEVKMKNDFFRLVWRAEHPRDGELRALANALRRIPLR